MKTKKYAPICAVFLFLCFQLFAQESNTSGLRAHNKIWVVMAVCLTILAGLLLLLFRIDRKLHQLENKTE